MRLMKRPLAWFLGAIAILVASNSIEILSTLAVNHLSQERGALRECFSSLQNLRLLIRNAEYATRNFILTNHAEDLDLFFNSENKTGIQLAQIKTEFVKLSIDPDVLDSIEMKTEKNLRA